MIRETISPEQARQFYDRIGSLYDLFGMFESKAKGRALELLDAEPGHNVLDVGVGTGKEHQSLCEWVSPGGLPAGIDLSPVMARLTRERTLAPVVVADTLQLPFRSGSFDRIFVSFVLDLIPMEDIPTSLREYRRTLKPDGRLVIITMTEGRDRASRALMAAWDRFYRIAPDLCGGCRPLRVGELVRQAGMELVQQEVIIQLGMPSEITIARA